MYQEAKVRRSRMTGYQFCLFIFYVWQPFLSSNFIFLISCSQFSQLKVTGKFCFFLFIHPSIHPFIHLLFLSVSRAKLKEQNGWFTKGDPYVKLIVDSKNPPKKTEAAKKTWEPVWDEHFTM